MDQYSKENAINSIDGYFFPTPFEQVTTTEKAFNRAKDEYIKKMRKRITDIDNINFGEFLKKTRRSK